MVNICDKCPNCDIINLRKRVITMDRIELDTGVGYFNLDIKLSLNTFSINILSFLYEPRCKSYVGKSDSFYHIIFYENGLTTVHFQNQNVNLPPKTFLFSPPNQMHSETVQANNNIKYLVYFSIKPKRKQHFEKSINVYLQESQIILQQLIEKDSLLFSKDNTETTSRILEEIFNELENKDFGYHYKLNCLFIEFFINYTRSLQNISALSSAGPETPSSDLISVNVSLDIAGNYKTVTLNHLSQKYYMSERQIRRYVKKIHQKPFKKRINDLRIEDAKKFLISTEFSISEVSRKVGFKYPSYFNEVFKKLEHMTPSEYKLLNSQSQSQSQDINSPKLV